MAVSTTAIVADADLFRRAYPSWPHAAPEPQRGTMSDLKASTVRAGVRDGGWSGYEGVLRDGSAIAWRCGHTHPNRDNSSFRRSAALECARAEARRREMTEAPAGAGAES